jgi:hypothetical protein
MWNASGLTPHSILAIADAAGGQWPDVARAAAVTLATQGRQSPPNLGIRLLADLRTVFGTGSALATTTILKGLQDLDESPWAELSGKPLKLPRLSHSPEKV